MKKKILVVGLGIPSLDEERELFYDVDAQQIHSHISAHDVLIAGKKLLELFPHFLGEKIAVTADIKGLVQRIKDNTDKGLKQVAIATGDPLCFGLGSTLIRHLGNESVVVMPSIGSLQGAASLLGFSSQEVTCVSLHGPREWHSFNKELLTGDPLFLFTDDKSHPGIIAKYMLNRGCSDYTMHILAGLHTSGGHIQSLENEALSLEEASKWELKDHGALPRVVVLFPTAHEKKKTARRSFGLSDDAFFRSDNVMTKRMARVQALGFLGIAPEHIVWDLGAGVGSISIEASRLAYCGQVFAIEKEASRVAHILENRRSMGAANLEVIHGELPHCLEVNKETFACTCNGEYLPRPDRIFIGGGCGTKEYTDDLLEKAWSALVDGGRLVVASILLSTFEKSRHFFERNGIKHEVFSIQGSEGKQLGEDVYMKASNLIQFVVGYK